MEGKVFRQWENGFSFLIRLLRSGAIWRATAQEYVIAERVAAAPLQTVFFPFLFRSRDSDVCFVRMAKHSPGTNKVLTRINSTKCVRNLRKTMAAPWCCALSICVTYRVMWMACRIQILSNERQILYTFQSSGFRRWKSSGGEEDGRHRTSEPEVDIIPFCESKLSGNWRVNYTERPSHHSQASAVILFRWSYRYLLFYTRNANGLFKIGFIIESNSQKREQQINKCVGLSFGCLICVAYCSFIFIMWRGCPFAQEKWLQNLLEPRMLGQAAVISPRHRRGSRHFPLISINVEQWTR